VSATVPKDREQDREQDRVVAVRQTLVLGTQERWDSAVEQSTVSGSITPSFVERHHGTDRGHNARKTRKTYRFRKDWRVHEAMTDFTLSRYNFCWAVRTVRVHREDGHGQLGPRQWPRAWRIASGRSV
jgi:hypothetical protein